MADVTRVAFQLDNRDLERLDEKVPGSYPSRAAALRAGVRDWLDRQRNAELDETLELAYADVPEDPRVTEAVIRSSRNAIVKAHLDW